MTPSTESDVSKVLKSIEIPEFGHALGDIAKIKASGAENGRVSAEIEFGMPIELARDALTETISRGLREALGAYGEVTGRSAAEDILDEIFSNFCIGK